MAGLSVAVLAGGRSSEHDVSLASGAAVVAGLAEAGHQPTLIEVDRKGVWRQDGQALTLTPGTGIGGVDIAFPVLHGPFGEDGIAQGLLEALGVPYVGSGVFASALCNDKLRTKQLLTVAGFDQVASVQVTDSDWSSGRDDLEQKIAAIGWPVWVKPARLGSSVGISRVDSAVKLGEAIAAALAYDPRVIVEQSSPGREIEVSVIERLSQSGTFELVTSPPGEIALPGAGPDDWYDYERKYEAGGMQLRVPAELDEGTSEAVRSTAAEAFAATGCSGYARVDCFVDGDRILINEINTAPGFTSTSVFAQLFASDGVTYPDLLDELVRTALALFEREAGYSF